MGDTAVISYRSLGEASSEARQVSRKLTGYADSLQRSIVNRLDSYGGSDSGGVTQAKQRTEEKIEQLRDKAQAYTKYADDLSDLQKKCLSTDTAVRSSVSGLTASFKKANGINNNGIVNTINYMLTGLGNSTPAGRWLGNTIDTANSAKDYLKQRIKDWWGYEGGKQLVKGITISLLEITIAGITFFSGGSLFVLIGAAIALVNGVFNLVNEGRAYAQTHYNEEPALGRRYSGEDTMQATMRRESDNKILHNIATGVDIVNAVCIVSSIIDSAGKVVKNCYKWAAGDLHPLDELKSLKILSSKENWTQFFRKSGASVKDGWKNITTAIGKGDVNFFKTELKNFRSDFIFNLRQKYCDFTPDHMADSIKDILGVTKNVVKDGIDIKNVTEDFIIPGVTVAKVTTVSTESGGQMRFDISNVTFEDAYNVADKTYNQLFKNILLQKKTAISLDVLRKLSTDSKIHIEIPRIYIPDNTIVMQMG